jgi:hypothetical protein
MGKRQAYSGFGRVRTASYGTGAARRRLKRIRFRENWSTEMWILVIAAIVTLLLAPKLADLHDESHHRRGLSSLKKPLP